MTLLNRRNEEISSQEWLDFTIQPDYRNIGVYLNEENDTKVSTIWTGNPGNNFETLVKIGNEHCIISYDYEENAIEGHERVEYEIQIDPDIHSIIVESDIESVGRVVRCWPHNHHEDLPDEDF